MSFGDPRFAPPPDWSDPRLAPDFDAAHFPRCDGLEPPPIGIAALNDQRKLEFLAAYYAINRAYAELEAAAEPERQAALLALNAVLTARDLLEDRYAPIGFYGEPRLDGYRTVDVLFMHAPVEPWRTPIVSSAAFVLTPAPPIPADASHRMLDTAGFLRFLEQQIGNDPPRDGEADS